MLAAIHAKVPLTYVGQAVLHAGIYTINIVYAAPKATADVVGSDEIEVMSMEAFRARAMAEA